MSLSAATVWEVRTTGSDSSGGGFVAGASGTDYSQQNAAQYSGTDLVIDGTTNTKVTSATHNFVATDVGNLIQITSGTGFTTGFFQIVSVASNAATLDRSAGTLGSTGGTFAVGGALATIGKLASAMVASNKAYLKGTGFTTTATITFAQSGVTPSATTPSTRLIGYAATRGDGGRAKLTLQTNTGLAGISLSNSGWVIENIEVDGSNLGTSRGIRFNGSFACTIFNCRVTRTTQSAIEINNTQCLVASCEVASFQGPAIYNSAGGIIVDGCYVHDGTSVTAAITVTAGSAVTRNLIANNAGASAVGIALASGAVSVLHNTVYNCGSHGIGGTANNFALSLRNNVFANNGGYGINLSSAAGTPASPLWDGNAYYGNTLGNRNNMDDTSTNAVNGVAPYANTLDVTCTASPFVDAAGGDFRLNSTAGGGAAVRGHGTPGALPGVSQVGYPDMGTYQHQDASGGIVKVGFSGGFDE